MEAAELLTGLWLDQSTRTTASNGGGIPGTLNAKLLIPDEGRTCG